MDFFRIDFPVIRAILDSKGLETPLIVSGSRTVNRQGSRNFNAGSLYRFTLGLQGVGYREIPSMAYDMCFNPCKPFFFGIETARGKVINNAQNVRRSAR